MKPIRFVSADEAVKVVKSGDHVHLTGVASAPQVLIKALCRRGDAGELKDVHIHHIHTEGPAPYTDPKYNGIFFHQALFSGANIRPSLQAGYADYIPVFLSEIGTLYRCGALPCDVAMIQVCPPDENGMVSLGTSVDATVAALEKAKTVIAVVNRNVPRSFGQSRFSMDRIDMFVEDDTPLVEAVYAAPDEVETVIGRHCAELIKDGACLQMGIGSLPNAVLSQLEGHKHLGVHTEMFADGVLNLVRKGVIDGSNKVTDKGKLVATFLLGSKDVYNFVNENPDALMMESAYTNDPFVISRNPRMTAINSAIQIDLTGQVCADSIGYRMYSGVGGQIDFVYGSSRAEEGVSIIAMPSMTKKGVSKINPAVMEGAGIVTTRAHMHWVVTEYGAVNLYGRSLQERARLLTSIAHPSVREELEEAAFKRFGPHYLTVK